VKAQHQAAVMVAAVVVVLEPLVEKLLMEQTQAVLVAMVLLLILLGVLLHPQDKMLVELIITLAAVEAVAKMVQELLETAAVV
jgi:hypothetical protein